MSVIVNPKKPAQPQTEGEMTAKRAAAEMGTFVDPRDSTEYKTCKIGNQVWLAENLKFELNSDDCVAYDDDYQYFDKYGYLYNEKGLEEAIPEGWHLPTRKEWETVIRFAKKDSRCKDVLSVLASEEWIESSSNKYGFSMVAGGMRYDNDDFDFIDFSAHFWCVEKTVDPLSHAIGRNKFYTSVRFENGVDENDDEEYPEYASVRLIKDED
jgi:uncharacterized protein (TIGR02145 family)